MKQNLLKILSLIIAPIPSAIALDLTPTVNEYTAEGMTFRQLTFKDGKRNAIYEPPRLWNFRGTGSSLQLTPANVDRADAIIQTVEAKAAPKWDEQAIDALREQFLRGLPPGSEAVTLIGEEQNPVSLENGVSCAFTASYRAIGEGFIRSVVIVNLPDTQLMFRLTARKADFEAVQRQFRSSICSWHWTEPSAPKTVVAQKSEPPATASRE